jgi:hypothetical protein
MPDSLKEIIDATTKINGRENKCSTKTQNRRQTLALGGHPMEGRREHAAPFGWQRSRQTMAQWRHLKHQKDQAWT